MKIKATLKKLKRGDILKINWIDAGDLDDSPSSWFSQEDAEKVFKEIPVETIAVYFGHGKQNLFLVGDFAPPPPVLGNLKKPSGGRVNKPLYDIFLENMVQETFNLIYGSFTKIAINSERNKL